jgi:thiamine-phosphate pyrophosphorylase
VVVREKDSRPLFLSPLMAVVDADVAARFGWTMTDLAAAYLSGGATLLQLRAKSAPSGWLLDVASTIVTLAHQDNALVIINDRADLARLSGADGVHVGQEDLPPASVRRVVGAEAIVGLSTHTPEQVDLAVREPVTYIAIGPVFSTGTKVTGYDTLGLGPVRRAAGRARERDLPLVAIGGVTLETAAEVIRAGATTVAVISDLVAGGDPAARVRAYLARLTV